VVDIKVFQGNTCARAYDNENAYSFNDGMKITDKCTFFAGLNKNYF